MMVDGFAGPMGAFTKVSRPVEIGKASRVELSFKAFAASRRGERSSHNSGVGLNSTRSRYMSLLSWCAVCGSLTREGGGPYWAFDARFGAKDPARYIKVPGGFDRAVSMRIVVDKVGLVVWGGDGVVNPVVSRDKTTPDFVATR